MTTKERVQAGLEHLSDDDLDELLRVIQGRAQASAPADDGPKPSLLSRLRQIQIDGPEDFAANLDAYASGEKRIGDSPNVR